MGPNIIVSAYALVEITKPRKVGLRHIVLEAGVCFGILKTWYTSCLTSCQTT